MALSGLRADYEIGKFGITPSQVAALKNLATPPAQAQVAPSVYSPAGGNDALNRSAAPQQQQPAVSQAAASTAPQATTNQRTTAPVQQPPAQILAARWLTGGGQPAAQAQGTTPPMIQGQPAASLATSPKQFQSTLANGITMTGGANGERTFTMGAPGTEGSGRVVAHGRTGPAMGAPREQAMRNLTGMQTATIQGANGPYSFQGSAADAMRFAQPIATPARVVMGQVAGGGDYRDVRDRHEAAKANLMQDPQYLGPESGLGWKTRLKKYEAELDAYNKATGNRTAMDIEAMREAGAGRRALLGAQGINDRNAIDMQQLVEGRRQFDAGQPVRDMDAQVKTMELGAAAQVDALRKKYAATTDPAERRNIQRDILALSGKPDNQKYQIVTKKETDPKTMMERQTNFAVNPDDPSQSFEIGGQGGAQNYEVAPNEASKRKKGAVYTTPKGPLMWNGTAWQDPT